VTRRTAPHFGYAPGYWKHHNAMTRPYHSALAVPETAGVALVMLVLLSLGLWGVIWLAVSSLV